MSYPTIGEKIRVLRKRNKLTMQELANAIGTSKENIYKYEHGIVKNIPFTKLCSISDVFHVELDYFLDIPKDTPPYDSTYKEPETPAQVVDLEMDPFDSQMGKNFRDVSEMLFKLSLSGQRKVVDYARTVYGCEKYMRGLRKQTNKPDQ